jgi:hypothetical protein
MIIRSFQLKKPHDNFSKIKNHIIFYTIFYSFSTKENPYLKIYLNGSFNVKLLIRHYYNYYCLNDTLCFTSLALQNPQFEVLNVLDVTENSLNETGLENIEQGSD